MALAAAAVPRTAARAPASPFAELLRRSRFGSFDPAIRQTYSSPPAYVHRGDWGLKRPLPIRRKNAFISITTFEHYAHFIEWNRAEDAVRFIRRVDEMDVLPHVSLNSPWHKGLGKARNEWLLDSEFCPEDMQDAQAKKDAENLAQQRQQHGADATTITATVDHSELGNQGPGGYGPNRPLPPTSPADYPDSRLMPNINAMSPKQFKRYLRHMRTLRPQFQQWIESNRDKPRIQDKPLYALAQNPETALHRFFIQDHLSEQLRAHNSTKFEQNPHRNAGLNYSHPTPLDTLYRTKPQPGIVLNTYSAHTRMGHHSSYVTGGGGGQQGLMYVSSFGGLTATLRPRDAGSKIPLINPDSQTGVEKDKVEQSFAQFRLNKFRGFNLDRPPRVVGRYPDTIDDVRVDARVTVVDSNSVESQMSWSNPHPLGSAEYVGATASSGSGSKSAPRDVVKKPFVMSMGRTRADDHRAATLLSSLSNMLNKDRGPPKEEGP